MTRRLSVRAIALALAIGGAAPSAAHEFAFTAVRLELTGEDTWVATMTVDVDALALGVSPRADSAEVAAAIERLAPDERNAAVERARSTILRRVRVRFDGVPAEPEVSFPGPAASDAATGAPPTVLGITARLGGRVPDGAESVTFFASRAFGPVHLSVVDRVTGGETRWVLDPGEESPPWPLGDAVAGTASPGPSRGRVVLDYAVLGFEHILPLGLDHILFVVGLYLLSARMAPLLWQVSAFTVAHTVTLALSVYGVVALPSRIVETVIALSIAYVAAENLVTDELKPWRPALVFAFGLLHGLGFAGALRALGLPPGETVTALVAFNVGVELGQLAVVGICFALLGRFRERPWYRARVVRPISAGIAMVGLYWAATRFFPGS